MLLVIPPTAPVCQGERLGFEKEVTKMTCDCLLGREAWLGGGACDAGIPVNLQHKLSRPSDSKAPESGRPVCPDEEEEGVRESERERERERSGPWRG